jgi:hypothetical protein
MRWRRRNMARRRERRRIKVMRRVRMSYGLGDFSTLREKAFRIFCSTCCAKAVGCQIAFLFFFLFRKPWSPRFVESFVKIPFLSRSKNRRIISNLGTRLTKGCYLAELAIFCQTAILSYMKNSFLLLKKHFLRRI